MQRRSSSPGPGVKTVTDGLFQYHRLSNRCPIDARIGVHAQGMAPLSITRGLSDNYGLPVLEPVLASAHIQDTPSSWYRTHARASTSKTRTRSQQRHVAVSLRLSRVQLRHQERQHDQQGARGCRTQAHLSGSQPKARQAVPWS